MRDWRLISIALLVSGAAVLGLCHAPSHAAIGEKTEKTEVSCRFVGSEGLPEPPTVPGSYKVTVVFYAVCEDA